MHRDTYMNKNSVVNYCKHKGLDWDVCVANGLEQSLSSPKQLLIPVLSETSWIYGNMLCICSIFLVGSGVYCCVDMVSSCKITGLVWDESLLSGIPMAVVPCDLLARANGNCI